MLTALSIRNIVLIDRLDMEFPAGLGVITGETGAGKSILLDAVGLALGTRAEARLLSESATQGSVIAAFELTENHPVLKKLAANGLEDGCNVLCKRILFADGRTRALINDQPVSVALLKEIGAGLVEIHGQHDDRGLVHAAGHRDLVDAFGGHGALLDKLEVAHTGLGTARTALAEAEAAFADARADEEFLRHAIDEICALTPIPGEEAELVEERSLLMQGERVRDTLAEMLSGLTGDDPVDSRLRNAVRRLERLPKEVERRFRPVIEALARAADDAGEGIGELDRNFQLMSRDPAEVEQIEERLFSLRALGRKHRVSVDELAACGDQMAERLALIENSREEIEKLVRARDKSVARFEAAAGALTKARTKAAGQLDKQVNRELGPLKLKNAKFRTALEPRERENWSGNGAETVAFEIATNSKSVFGPLNRIASGGELSRIILALKVALAGRGSAPTLIFDEVDRGVGGAVADAVGERLKQLSTSAQVLLVTHAPQVAALGDHHWRIAKSRSKKAVVTQIERLADTDRREEIARMLSGKTITEEARRAADSLINRAV